MALDVPQLPGFLLRAPITDLLHVGLPAAIQAPLDAHPELSNDVRSRSREMARKLAPG